MRAAWVVAVIGCHAAPPVASPHADRPAPPPPSATPQGIADLDAYCDDKLNIFRQTATQEAADDAARAGSDDGYSGGPTHEEPTCEARDVHELAAPYLAAAILRVSNEDLVQGTCQLAIQTAAGWFLVGDALDCGTFGPRDRTRNLTLVGAKQAGATLELALHYSAQPFDSVPNGPPSTSLTDIGDDGAEVDFASECTFDHALACKQQ
ncbi:MAG TPA: hypothetical protein VH143_13430 [Kofleriaceae bacterium]|jgi:hypothetical protein|nr:hypothetical protein [Kofleriaceae bacterium]